MTEHDDLAHRYRSCVEDLSRSEEWGLHEAEVTRYVEQLLARVPAASPERQLLRIVGYYHREHKQAMALADPKDPEHAAAWQWALQEIQRVLRIKGLNWSSDRSVDLEDLAQTAQIEVARAIVDYRYESSLRTWLQSVVKRRLLRFHRDSQAEKRAVRPESLDAAEYSFVAWEDFEEDINATALVAMVERVLGSASDERLAVVFRLRHIHDWSAEEIGVRIRLHPSRVRVLLQQARALLARDAELRRWFSDGRETSA